jgi:hypothetical protein
VPSLIESRVIEEVTRPDKLTIGNLETESHHPWRTVEAARITLPDSYWHNGAMMGASHPAFHYVRRCEGFQYFTHGGKFALGANDADRVILAYVSACHQGQPLSR